MVAFLCIKDQTTRGASSTSLSITTISFPSFSSHFQGFHLLASQSGFVTIGSCHKHLDLDRWHKQHAKGTRLLSRSSTLSASPEACRVVNTHISSSPHFLSQAWSPAAPEWPAQAPTGEASPAGHPRVPAPPPRALRTSSNKRPGAARLFTAPQLSRDPQASDLQAPPHTHTHTRSGGQAGISPDASFPKAVSSVSWLPHQLFHNLPSSPRERQNRPARRARREGRKRQPRRKVVCQA